tara:strand:+ start:137 stop:532 length:396 start_codon:yes stop_codon:yes gene_type:complete
MKFHHIGIIVKDINYGLKFYRNIFLKLKVSNTIIDKKIGVKIKFLSGKNNVLIELISPYGKFSPIKNLINQKKAIINHLAYKVRNLDNQMTILKKKKCLQISNPIPAKAFNGKRVVFFMTPLNHIIELIED